MRFAFRQAQRLFDLFESYWYDPRRQRVVGSVLVIAFVGMLVVVELRRRDLLPQMAADYVPRSHFAAVNLAFTLLLLAEVIWLILGLARSVADSVGRQFEILSLILLRESFEEFAFFHEPLTWEEISQAIPQMGAHAIGALLIFVVVGVYYRMQRHLPITGDEEDQSGFVAAKKTIAIALLLVFVAVGLNNVGVFMLDDVRPHFFDVFFTVLVFSDILIVLISLRYSHTYHVAFRNSGFAVATVFIRLALIAPPPLDVALGIGTAVFALGLTLAYNVFAPVLREKRTA